MTSKTSRNKTRDSFAVVCGVLALTLAGVAPVLAADADFAGQWMLTIEAPDVVPYTGLLEIGHKDDAWRAHVEHGPAPIKIDGNNIQLTIDARDRQGFKFDRVLEGTLADGEMSGIMHSVGILQTAAEYGEDGSPWRAVRVASIPPRHSDHSIEDFAGTWVGIRGVDLRKYTMDLKPSARQWHDGYDARMDEPQKRCVSPGLIATTTWIFPFEIIVSNDNNRLTMMYEVFGQSRRIFMNQTDMPEFYPESSLGYSQGRMEDGELVIETTLLSASTRDFNGEPVGENTRVVERYFLTNDGKRLNMILKQYDPENYRRAPIRRRAWDRDDSAVIFPYECDPDSFFRQLFEEGRMQEYIDRAYRRP